MRRQSLPCPRPELRSWVLGGQPACSHFIVWSFCICCSLCAGWLVLVLGLVYSLHVLVVFSTLVGCLLFISLHFPAGPCVSGLLLRLSFLVSDWWLCCGLDVIHSHGWSCYEAVSGWWRLGGVLLWNILVTQCGYPLKSNPSTSQVYPNWFHSMAYISAVPISCHSRTTCDNLPLQDILLD